LALSRLNVLVRFAAHWLPAGAAWMLVLTGALFGISLARSFVQSVHYTVWHTADQLGSRGGMAVSSTGKAYYNPGKERSKIQKKVKKAEEDLAVKEAKLDELKAELMKPEYQSSYSKLTEIQNEIDALEEEILIDMEAWEELSSQLEALG
jgi:peptidoglycan hydrolase CwlO-like protein